MFHTPACTRQPLHWRHNDHDGVSNHQPHGCLLNRLFRRRSKETSKLRVTGLCVGNSPVPVNSPHKGPVTRKMFPFDDVIMLVLNSDSLVPILRLCALFNDTICINVALIIFPTDLIYWVRVKVLRWHQFDVKININGITVHMRCPVSLSYGQEGIKSVYERGHFFSDSHIDGGRPYAPRVPQGYGFLKGFDKIYSSLPNITMFAYSTANIIFHCKRFKWNSHDKISIAYWCSFAFWYHILIPLPAHPLCAILLTE